MSSTGDIVNGRRIISRDTTRRRKYWWTVCIQCESLKTVRADNIGQPCHCSRESHGMSRTKTYKAWQSMRSLCGNPKNSAFIDYGGRGISVCLRWSDFEKFLEDMGEAPTGRILGRKDINGDYTPSNCRWATYSQQNNNRRALKNGTTRRRAQE